MTATVPPPPPPPATPGPGQEPLPGPATPQVTWRDRLERTRAAVRASNEGMTPGGRAFAWTLGVLAALALWLVIFGLLLSGLVESHDQHGLYATFRSQLAGGVAPVGGQIPDGDPVALLSSPDAGIDNLIAVQGSTSSDLQSGPGHVPNTPLPGQPGWSFILGRSTSFGAPFAGITDLHKGSKITVTTGQGKFVYVVSGVRRPNDPTPGSFAASGSRLTLVTAAGGGWRSGWAPNYTVYVDADLQGKAMPGGGVSVATDSDYPMKRDTSGLYPLVLWLQLLVVAAVGGIWLRSRSGRAHAWLLALPVGAAALWGASQEAWLLLPNLL